MVQSKAFRHFCWVAVIKRLCSLCACERVCACVYSCGEFFFLHLIQMCVQCTVCPHPWLRRDCADMSNFQDQIFAERKLKARICVSRTIAKCQKQGAESKWQSQCQWKQMPNGEHSRSDLSICIIRFCSFNNILFSAI